MSKISATMKGNHFAKKQHQPKNDVQNKKPDQSSGENKNEMVKILSYSKVMLIMCLYSDSVNELDLVTFHCMQYNYIISVTAVQKQTLFHA